MKVSELAKELNTTSDEILSTLKSLKLKAKNSKQDLSAAAITVVKSEFKKGGRKKAPEPEPKKKAVKAKKAAAGKPKAVKTAKTAAPKKAGTKRKTIKTKRVVKTTKKKTVKKKAEPDASEEKAPKKKTVAAPFVTLKPLAKKRKRRPLPGAQPQLQKDSAEKPKSVEDDSSSEAAVEVVQKEYARVEGREDLEIRVPISVKDFAVRIQQKPSVILMKLMKMGIFANINMSMEEDVVRKLADEFEFNLTKVKTQEEQLIDMHKEEEDDPDQLEARAPVVTFMGHVDHGKTSLLDKIRKSKVADDEHGGITQHIGAYSVSLKRGKITFLDTPGHEAFTAMRARGAHITDLVVVVIAADEGIMPQTEEAIDHARAAEVPIIIALNKIDRKNADVDRVKKQLADKDLNPEDWGGKTICVGVSAITGEGIDNLLEMILLEAELLELKANARKKATGIVVEAHISRGKGSVADLIVQSGTLKEGEIIVVGTHYGRIKAMLDDHERNIKEAGPSTPVEIIGLQGVPEAGEIFYVVDDEKSAKEISTRRQELMKNRKLAANQKITLEDLQAQIQEGVIKELSVIIKADVQGSLEALIDSLQKIPSEEVKLKFIHTGVGEVNISDVLLATASKAIIICFHVGVGSRAQNELEKHPVDVRKYRIIYDAVQDIRSALEGLLEPTVKKKFLSRVEIREVFKLSKAGIVAGCFVQKGKVHRKDHIDIIRNGKVEYSGVIAGLKRFKDDVREVAEGTECGITIDGYDKVQVGDIIESYELEQIIRKL